MEQALGLVWDIFGMHIDYLSPCYAHRIALEELKNEQKAFPVLWVQKSNSTYIHGTVNTISFTCPVHIWVFTVRQALCKALGNFYLMYIYPALFTAGKKDLLDKYT